MKYINRSVLLSVVVLLLTACKLQAGVDTKEMVSFPASPSDAGFYLAIEGGVSHSNFVNESQPNSSKTLITHYYDECGYEHTNKKVYTTSPQGLSSELGGVAGLRGGYKLQSFSFLQPAFEAEGLHLGNSNYDAGALFANAILNFKTGTRITPFVGVGAGGEYFDGLPGGSALAPAVQGIAGVSYKIDRHWSVFTAYHFIDAFNVSTNSFSADQLQQHVVTVGAGYNF